MLCPGLFPGVTPCRRMVNRCSWLAHSGYPVDRDTVKGIPGPLRRMCHKAYFNSTSFL